MNKLEFKAKSRVGEFLIEKFIALNAFAALIVICLIFIFIFKEALPIFTDDFIKEEASVDKMVFKQSFAEGREAKFSWQPNSDNPRYSLLPLFIGTMKAAIIAMLFAVPFGVGGAIYSSQFASKRMKEIIKPAIEMLAGIPSIVLGFLALIVMASFLQDIFGYTYRLNAFNAGLALGLAVIPIIFTISEDALNSVPQSLKDASMALGANQWQVSFTAVLPAAFPGIAAGLVLGFGRAVGETMIVLMASGNAAIVSLAATDSIRTFSATIAAELAEVVFGSAHYSVLFFIGILLFLFTFVVNLGGDIILVKLRQRIQGEMT